eukprot:GHVN01105858.1.p1 GENE.GHVN01105858.1~~GHVN01105858.1.p1  ORF type:complete len:547 (+),score=102.88 GHVN01105858.1:967-2607(+)
MLLAVERFSQVSNEAPELANMYDNDAELYVDLAWHLYLTGRIDMLPDGTALLKRAEEKLKISHGPNLERLRRLKENEFVEGLRDGCAVPGQSQTVSSMSNRTMLGSSLAPELRIYARLYLLKGVVDMAVLDPTLGLVPPPNDRPTGSVARSPPSTLPHSNHTTQTSPTLHQRTPPPQQVNVDRHRDALRLAHSVLMTSWEILARYSIDESDVNALIDMGYDAVKARRAVLIAKHHRSNPTQDNPFVVSPYDDCPPDRIPMSVMALDEMSEHTEKIRTRRNQNDRRVAYGWCLNGEPVNVDLCDTLCGQGYERNNVIKSLREANNDATQALVAMTSVEEITSRMEIDESERAQIEEIEEEGSHPMLDDTQPEVSGAQRPDRQTAPASPRGPKSHEVPRSPHGASESMNEEAYLNTQVDQVFGGLAHDVDPFQRFDLDVSLEMTCLEHVFNIAEDRLPPEFRKDRLSRVQIVNAMHTQSRLYPATGALKPPLLLSLTSTQPAGIPSQPRLTLRPLGWEEHEKEPASKEEDKLGDHSSSEQNKENGEGC